MLKGGHYFMKKLKNLTLKCASFMMATVMVGTGFLDSLTLSSKRITGNISNGIVAEAAETGTVNADTFSWDNASVYFLLTDRFRNGDTSNDHSYNRGLDKNGNVINVSDDRGTFHGGDFKGVTQSIKEGYFNNLGVNAIWISAPYEQIHGYIVGGDGSPSFAHYSYHGYYVLDYTNSDANFGTMDEFKELVDTAHEHGIRVVMDIVLNHAGYNSLYDMNEYGFGSVKSGWEDYYYSMTNVNNKDYHSYIDYEADALAWGKWWGADWVRAGLPGYKAGGGDSYTMSLAGLPDFRTESTATVGIPAFLEKKWKSEGRYDSEVAELKSYLSSHGYDMTVTNCISYWLSSWVRDYGVDGFRCDTAKHVEFASWKRLNDMCTEALKTWKANNPDKKLDDLDFWMTGECWDHGVANDEYYSKGGFDSMINFETTGGGMLAEGRIESVYARYATEINDTPDFNVLSYMSSHDSTLARGNMVYLGSALLLLPGGIQIYYGDETNRGLVDSIPFDGNGGAGHSLRSDMNWDSIDETVLSHWQKVGTFRNSHIAVGAGQNTTITTSSGHAFTRTYESGNIKDRVAFCIAAAANTEVTMDVSNVWKDGDRVVNYYDSSSAVVTDGKVTFNSGANGTVLVQDPDGKPLVTINGEAKFKGTQKVTVSLKDTKQAVISVDGAKKFIVKDGDSFTIGATAYEGDTVTVSYTAENEKGVVNGKATFYKAYGNEDIGGGGEEEKEDNIIRIKMANGSAPYLYAWTGASTALTAAWPGTKLTEKDSEGYYTFEFAKDISTYNVIISDGGTGKTSDITGLKGKVTVNVASDFTTNINGGSVETVENTVTIHIKPYSDAAPFLYVWDNSGSYNGGFPGKQLSNPDADGWYTFVKEGVTSLNCIVGDGGSTNRTGDITGITSEAWITIKSADNTKYDIEKAPVIESKYTLLRKEARAVKNLTVSDYTQASYKKLYSYIAKADKLVALGEKEADITEVETTYSNIINAKKALVLATPSISSASAGSKAITGKAAYGSKVTVKLNNKTYTAVTDEITGVWKVNVATALKSTDVLYVSANRDDLKSGELTYKMSGGDVITVGWKEIDGKWYYFDASGVMQTSKWINSTYYVKADGTMAKSQLVDNNKYYVDANGKWDKTTKWLKINNKWYYNVSGKIQKSKWVSINSKWYYFGTNGDMQTSKWINKTYYVQADGTMAKSKLVDNNKYYVDANGKWDKTTKWLKINNKWYYNVSGNIQKSKWVKINSKWYHFDASGAMETSKWINGTYYVQADGTMAVSKWVDGNKYYVGADGKWVKNK